MTHEIEENYMAQFHAETDVEDDTENDVVSLELDESLDFDDIFDEERDREDADDDTEQIVASPSLTSASVLVWTKKAPLLAGRQPNMCLMKTPASPMDFIHNPD